MGQTEVENASQLFLVRNRYVLLIDLPLIAAAAFGGFALRFDWRFYQHSPEFLPYLLIALVAKPIVFYLCGLYQRFWRYASVSDMLAIVMAVSASSLVMAVCVTAFVFMSPSFAFSRVVFVSDWLLTMILAGGVRLALRVFGDAQSRAKGGANGGPVKRVLVAGAGYAGMIVVRELRRNGHLGKTPVGFLDDDRAKHGKRINGVEVLGDLSALGEIVRDERIDEVIVAMPSAPGPVVRKIADACREAGVPSTILPGVFELLGGRVSISRLRTIEITDLLRRAPIGAEADAPSYVTGRRVLVTGAGGSIGFELCRQAAIARPERLILLGHGENSLFDAAVQLREEFPAVSLQLVIADVRDRDRLRAVFERERPQLVFHAAAHKHVPLMEDNPEEAIFNNIVGTANVVDAAVGVKVERLVMISTDKAVAPTNIMGASKRVAERIVRDAAGRHRAAFMVVRFGNVLGSRGSVVPLFKRQIERGGPVTITHPDMRRFFMTIPEAVHLTLQAGGVGRGGELFVLDMGEPVRIVDLARDLITLSGFDDDEIPIVYTGTRPGEKLDERLWDDGATVEQTSCAGILKIAEPFSGPAATAEALVEAFSHAAATGNRLTIQAELARWVPNYVPEFVSG